MVLPKNKIAWNGVKMEWKVIGNRGYFILYVRFGIGT